MGDMTFKYGVRPPSQESAQETMDKLREMLKPQPQPCQTKVEEAEEQAMIAIINPGSGPVDGASVAEADKNMAQLVEDTGAVRFERKSDKPDGGRFRYDLVLGEAKSVEVEMPGLPLDQVRWMDHSQNIWAFPRMYVEGNSWIWKIAIDVIKDAAKQDEEEEA